jgi:hypothetical protein
MEAINGNILVRVNLEQNREMKVGETSFKTGKRYNENFRERVPVVAEVVQGNDLFNKGDFIVTVYTHFDDESPFYLFDDLYSIPVDEQIFAKILFDGSLEPVCGNVLVSRTIKTYSLETPIDLVKTHTDRGWVITNSAWHKVGEFILWLKMADYEIVYTWQGIEHRAIKVHKDEIVGILER